MSTFTHTYTNTHTPRHNLSFLLARIRLTSWYCGQLWQKYTLIICVYLWYLCQWNCLWGNGSLGGCNTSIRAAQDVETLHRGPLHKACVLFQTCTVCLSSLCLICTVNLQSLCLDRAWSMNQTNKVWQPSSFLHFWSQATLGEAVWYLILLTLLVSKVICCQLTGLIGMAGSRSFGEEWGVPAHAHLAHEQGVELTHILCWGFSKKKGCFGRRPLWVRLPRGSKGSRQSASSTQILASVQIPQRNS